MTVLPTYVCAKTDFDPDEFGKFLIGQNRVFTEADQNSGRHLIPLAYLLLVILRCQKSRVTAGNEKRR